MNPAATAPPAAPAPYRAYAAAVSACPGRSGCAVVVTRGAARAEKTTTIDHATLEEAAVAAALVAVALLASKRDAPVVLVVPPMAVFAPLARSDAQEPPPHEPAHVASLRAALELARRGRAAAAPLRLELAPHELHPELARAHALAWAAAWPGSAAPPLPVGVARAPQR